MKKVEIDTLVCGDQKNIVVDKAGVRVTGGDVIEFKNKLDGRPTANLKFYTMDDKGGMEISGFYKDNPSFSVPGRPPGKAECELTQTGDFAYSIEAVGHTPLDPVIIIDPRFINFFPGIGGSPIGIGVLIVLFLLGLIGAYKMGTARGARG